MFEWTLKNMDNVLRKEVGGTTELDCTEQDPRVPDAAQPLRPRSARAKPHPPLHPLRTRTV